MIFVVFACTVCRVSVSKSQSMPMSMSVSDASICVVSMLAIIPISDVLELGYPCKETTVLCNVKPEPEANHTTHRIFTCMVYGGWKARCFATMYSLPAVLTLFRLIRNVCNVRCELLYGLTVHNFCFFFGFSMDLFSSIHSLLNNCDFTEQKKPFSPVNNEAAIVLLVLEEMKLISYFYFRCFLQEIKKRKRKRKKTMCYLSRIERKKNAYPKSVNKINFAINSHFAMMSSSHSTDRLCFFFLHLI